MFTTLGLPAFTDNYLWLVASPPHAIAVDPGDASVVESALRQYGWRLSAIVLTHHHHDHTGGVEWLAHQYRCPVIGPAHETIAGVTHLVAEGDQICLLDKYFRVFDVPGHTLGHVAYWCAETRSLFCGDTLFGAGCGRLFEGSAEQMWHSLVKLAGLPDDTQVYCAHEYTLANLTFAQVVEPDNPRIQTRIQQVQVLRRQGLASVPFTLATERDTNPFLRAECPDVQRSAREHSVHWTATVLTAFDALPEPIATFARLRAWKDTFRVTFDPDA